MSEVSLSRNGDKSIIIYNKNRCNGITKKREQCKKEIFNGKFCHLHLYQQKEIENKEEIKEDKKVIEPKYIFDESFYKIKLIEDKQKALKNKLLSEIEEKARNLINKKEIDKKIKEEKKIEEIPIQLRFKEDTCCICQRDFESNYNPIKPCFHWVHKACMIKFGSQNCPYCRTQVKFNQRQVRELKIVQDKKKKEKEEEERSNIIRNLYNIRNLSAYIEDQSYRDVDIYDNNSEYFIGYG